MSAFLSACNDCDKSMQLELPAGLLTVSDRCTESRHLVVRGHPVRHAVRLLPFQQQGTGLHPEDRDGVISPAFRHHGAGCARRCHCSAQHGALRSSMLLHGGTSWLCIVLQHCKACGVLRNSTEEATSTIAATVELCCQLASVSFHSTSQVNYVLPTIMSHLGYAWGRRSRRSAKTCWCGCWWRTRSGGCRWTR